MPYALALGFFDGIHIGHAALLRRTLEMADTNGLTAAVCTLDRSPASAFGRGDTRLINSPDDRRYILKRFFGIDEVFELKFDRRMQTLAPQDFVPMLVSDFDARGLVCGCSYTFGDGARGNAETLRNDCERLGLDCSVVDEVRLDGEAVSSTRIRALLEQGETIAAQRLLGHPHILGGTVEHGRALGRTLGFPTANLPIPDGVLAPKYGVYAVRVDIDGERLDGIANVGEKPIVGGAKVGAEVHIFDFSGDIYGKRITVEFDRFIRPERKFDDISALEVQVEQDKLAAKDLLKVTLRTTD